MAVIVCQALVKCVLPPAHGLSCHILICPRMLLLTTFAALLLCPGPSIPWRPGRVDKASGNDCPVDGRLPDAAQGAGHVRDVFGRMGFDDR
jgi:hypothetical protein